MTGAQAFAAWRADPGRDAMMRDATWRGLGVARVRAGNGATWWAATFGTVNDCAANPVAGATPAFTVSAATTTVGATLTVTNLSRTTTGKFAPGSFNAGNGTASATLAAKASVTFSYPSVGTKLPALTVAQVRVRAPVTVT
jgi:hypothetical protein